MTPAGREIGIQQNQAVFSLIGRIQEETHRFAITFNRESHGKRVRGSALDEIPGVGPSRRKALMKYFKSIEELRAADAAQISEVPGITSRVAEEIYTFFRKKES